MGLYQVISPNICAEQLFSLDIDIHIIPLKQCYSGNLRYKQFPNLSAQMLQDVDNVLQQLTLLSLITSSGTFIVV